MARFVLKNVNSMNYKIRVIVRMFRSWHKIISHRLKYANNAYLYSDYLIEEENVILYMPPDRMIAGVTIKPLEAVSFEQTVKAGKNVQFAGAINFIGLPLRLLSAYLVINLLGAACRDEAKYIRLYRKPLKEIRQFPTEYNKLFSNLESMNCLPIALRDLHKNW